MKQYNGLTLDEERALYGVKGAQVIDCAFAGPADGESALKETSGLSVENCRFLLRYPLWHSHNTKLSGCTMTDTCRAALWYDSDLVFEDCTLGGIKALRECDRTEMYRCRIESQEFGWFCRGLKMEDCEMGDCDLSFEKSEVQATIRGSIDSVKNPTAGRIAADRIGKIILDDSQESRCEIICRSAKNCA